MGKLAKQALYSYQYEARKRRDGKDRRWKLIEKWRKEATPPGQWEKSPNFYGLVKIIRREKNEECKES